MFRSTLYKCFLDNDRHGASTNSLGSLFCCLTTLRVNKFFLIPSLSLIIRTNTKLLWAAASSIWLWLDPAIVQGCQEVHASPRLGITRHGSPWFKQEINHFSNWQWKQKLVKLNYWRLLGFFRQGILLLRVNIVLKDILTIICERMYKSCMWKSLFS